MSVNELTAISKDAVQLVGGAEAVQSTPVPIDSVESIAEVAEPVTQSGTAGAVQVNAGDVVIGTGDIDHSKGSGATFTNVTGDINFGNVTKTEDKVATETAPVVDTSRFDRSWPTLTGSSTSKGTEYGG